MFVFCNNGQRKREILRMGETEDVVIETWSNQWHSVKWLDFRNIKIRRRRV